MDYRLLPLISGRFLLFLAESLILIACISYIQILYANDILPDKLVRENYPQSICTIVSKELSEKGKLIHRYRADFLVSYAVQNKTFQVWVTGNGLDQSYFPEKDAQQETLDQFEQGSTYPCWYNPQIPQIAVLVLRHDWESTIPLLVPTTIGLITLYYLLKNILQFLGILRYKTREIIQKRKPRP